MTRGAFTNDVNQEKGGGGGGGGQQKLTKGDFNKRKTGKLSEKSSQGGGGKGKGKKWTKKR